MTEDKDCVDRRDFMAGSIAAVGVSAIVLSEAGAANAQQKPETHTPTAGTVFTGDVIQGKRVVSRLDVADLEPGEKASSLFSGRSDAGRPALACVCRRRQGHSIRQALHPDERRAWRRDKLDPNGPDRDGSARSNADVRHGHGGARRGAPGCGKHAAPMAQLGARRWSHRHEPRVARETRTARAPQVVTPACCSTGSCGRTPISRSTSIPGRPAWRSPPSISGIAACPTSRR